MDRVCRQSGDACLSTLFERYPEIRKCEPEIKAAREAVLCTFRKGGKLLACGNGGSASDSEHVVGELMKSFRFKRAVESGFVEAYREAVGAEPPSWLEGALPAISLVSQTSLMTAFSNDESAAGVFAQQVYGYGRRGDTLLAISTSGNSQNVVEAAKVARALGVSVVSLTGAAPSALSDLSDICVRVPASEVFRIQELHLPVYHALCAAIEADMFGGAE